MANGAAWARSHPDYTIACFCPMGVELAAVEGMLDEIHQPLSVGRDQNAYTLGHISMHNIVVVVLPEIGTNAAAAAVIQLQNDFPSIRFGLLVGIGGGVPGRVDIRLGDVAVSRATSTFGGVVQFDLGKRVGGGRFQRTGLLNKPPQILSANVQKLDSQHRREGHRLLDFLSMMIDRHPSMRELYAYPEGARDDLFQSSYIHVAGTTCDMCDRQWTVTRPVRSNQAPQIHYGTIGSANIVLKDANLRDELLHDMDLICVEMEAAGLLNDFPCLVVRGICDYADSHKNKQWQPYAAAVAAAYMKELLLIIPAQQAVQTSSLESMAPSGDSMDWTTTPVDHSAVDEDVLASLAFPQMRDRQLDVHTQTPHPNTCQWILGSLSYQEWTAQSHGLLWIKGKPGAGKSTIMSFLYNTLRSNSHTEADALLEFFFSARGVQLQRSFVGMLRSLLNQVFRLIPQCRNGVRKYFQEKCVEFGGRGGAWEWHEQELRSLLLVAIVAAARHRSILVFIDALDEADNAAARTIAEYFHELNERAASASVPVKICISCRHYPIFSLAWGTEVCVEDHNHADIAAYVRDRFDLICARSMVSNHDHEGWISLQDFLVERTNGVFQWIHLMMEIVEECLYDGYTPDEVLHKIQELPEKISDVYEHILVNVIKPQSRSQAFLLFQWVCLAEQPLTLEQMRYALATAEIVPDSPSIRLIKCKETSVFIKTDDMMKNRIRALSGGLLEVVDGRIQVGHQTVNEFLLQRGLALMASHYTTTKHHLVTHQPQISTWSDHDPVMYQCQSRLYWSCLRYLATEQVIMEDADYFFDDNIERCRKVQTNSPLIAYATMNMFVHAEKAKEYRTQDLAKERELLDAVMSSWISIYRAFAQYTARCPEPGMTSLHVAASAGLSDMTAFLLEINGACDQQDSQGNTALHLATRWGHEQVVDTLIRAGAKVNQRTVKHQTALTLAAANGHLSLIRLLLGQGAQLEGGIGEHENALYAASSAGHEQAVRVFLASGADVNAQGGYFGNALQAAMAQKHVGVVRILLEAGADVNAQGGYYGNALQAAAVNKDEKAVRFLLTAGAHVNAQGGHYGTALQAASYTGNVTVVRMLLRAGAKVNAQGGRYGNAYQAASAHGHQRTMEALLKAGAQRSRKGTRRW